MSFDRASLAAIAALREAGEEEHLALPDYSSYGFAELPAFVLAQLCGTETALRAEVAGRVGAPPEAVVLVLLDGFGWSYFARFADELPFLRRMLSEGSVAQISSQFPSTTAAQITTLHTGAPVGASGIFEWQYFEPELDAIYMPLPALATDGLSWRPVEPEPGQIYPERTLYHRLGEHGVRSFVYQDGRYAGSTASRALAAGAQRVPFRSFAEALTLLGERLGEGAGPSYHCVYFDVIDAISHAHGPDSPHVEAEIRAMFRLLEDELVAAVQNTDTLVLVTADHGHISVHPEKTIYLDRLWPALTGMIHTNAKGTPSVPAGSARDLFLYVKPEHLEEAEQGLVERLDGVATVHRTETLVERGHFGEIQERLRTRLAPLVVLPRPHETVWWSDGGRFDMPMRGHHGGLSRDELEIPLLSWRAA